MLGGASLLLAAVLVQFVHDQPHTAEQLAQVVEEEEMFPGITPPEPPPRA